MVIFLYNLYFFVLLHFFWSIFRQCNILNHDIMNNVVRDSHVYTCSSNCSFCTKYQTSVFNSIDNICAPLLKDGILTGCV